MTLELKHPVRGVLGTVEVDDGYVTDSKSRDFKGLVGMTREALQKYAESRNWIICQKVVEP